MTPDLFQPLPPHQHIPATVARAVSLMQSINVERMEFRSVLQDVRASVVSVFTLRGTYHVYVYFAGVKSGEGQLYSSPQAECEVTRYGEVESVARRWLESLGFSLTSVTLGALAPKARAEKLSYLPFALKEDIAVRDPAQLGLSGGDALSQVFGELEPVEILRRLRGLVLLS